MGQKAEAWRAIARALAMCSGFALEEGAKWLRSGADPILILGTPVPREMLVETMRWAGHCPECGRDTALTCEKTGV